jgi:hypothetical protein
MSKAEWWERQAKQNEGKALTTTEIKQDNTDKDKIIKDLRTSV